MEKIICVYVVSSMMCGNCYRVAYASGARRIFTGWCPSTVRAYLNQYMSAADKRALWYYGEVLVSRPVSPFVRELGRYAQAGLL